MALMLYLAGFTVYTSFKDLKSFQEFGNNIMHNAAFRNIVISLLSTYGVYFLASFLHFEPWHMFTSFIQYLFLMPSFINILMVYAFCNTHDVSWGTKGDDGSKSAEGHVQSKTNAQGVEVAAVSVPVEQVDINALYDKLIQDLKNKPKEVKQGRDAATKREDHNKIFRTRLVLSWIFSNALLIVLLTSGIFAQLSEKAFGDPLSNFNPYLTFLFWSVAALSLVRFVGSCWYLIARLIFG